MSKSKTFTITESALKSARKMCVINGVDFSKPSNLPTTAKKMAKLETLAEQKIAGIHAAAAAAHLLTFKPGAYTAGELLKHVNKGMTKQEFVDMFGSAKLYDKGRFYRNAILSYIATGNMPNADESRRVDVKTGLVKAEKAKEPKAKQARGARQPKGPNVTPSEVMQANNAGVKVTTDETGAVVDIEQVTARDVERCFKKDSAMAALAILINNQLVLNNSHDPDDKDVAFDDLHGWLTKAACEVLAAKNIPH